MGDNGGFRAFRPAPPVSMDIPHPLPGACAVRNFKDSRSMLLMIDNHH